ncbi:DUF1993 domain-containing protein [Aurantimonas endophytica]|uniref:DUF1993 domain-containing protein n=1 Tax=Aurantimonas endophytica TaxID=1522175 RepID=A0A7W6HE36_9HYPH|nr:DUF1993 domain-containing protein [Aurantimonas endophytica]MBB4003346.1 hypothetical protein [Aurantimonas endophytica]MCO6404207.1 DUF1993 family protein [Aurantimonas endophytica]
MSLYTLTIPTFTQMLGSLSGLLEKAETHAGDGAGDLLSERLAPDMFPLADQVRFSCIQVVEALARLQGQDVPPMLARQETVAAMQSQIAETRAVLRAASAEAIDAAAERVVDLRLPNGMAFRMSGAEFVRDWALPQFYFHVVTAYAILRHIGVDLGKADYVRHMAAYHLPGAMPPSAG